MKRLLARFMNALPLACMALFMLVMVVGTLVSHKERLAHQKFQRELASVSIEAPAGRPSHSQESIDLAMTLYSIDAPRYVMGPRYDAWLDDRGLTTGGTLSRAKTVSIGPAAFTSWGILGSTLGHEIEIHARQSFLQVILLDKVTKARFALQRSLAARFPSLRPTSRDSFENEGTWRAEREAYEYELRSARRFQLTPAETRAIVQIMDFYYPTKWETGLDPEDDDDGPPEKSARVGGLNRGSQGQ